MIVQNTQNATQTAEMHNFAFHIHIDKWLNTALFLKGKAHSI